jgi:5-enolpyruvylshikimate-3-phosphate synthase
LVNALGGDIKEYDDGFDIRGPITSPQHIHFDAHFDHRLAMSGLIAANAFGITANIDGKDSIPTSFPNFLAMLDAWK